MPAWGAARSVGGVEKVFVGSSVGITIPPPFAGLAEADDLKITGGNALEFRCGGQPIPDPTRANCRAIPDN